MQKSKGGTSRINVYNEIGCKNSYTFETSFNGSDWKANFEESDYLKLGEDFCYVLALFLGKKFKVKFIVTIILE